jgi:hypothetical protein
VDRTNAERQRRYIERLKQTAAAGVSNAKLEGRIRELEAALAEARKAAVSNAQPASIQLGSKSVSNAKPATVSNDEPAAAVSNAELQARIHKLEETVVRIGAEKLRLQKKLQSMEQKLQNTERYADNASRLYELPSKVLNTLRINLHPDGQHSSTVETRAEAFRLLQAWKELQDKMRRKP